MAVIEVGLFSALLVEEPLMINSISFFVYALIAKNQRRVLC